MRRRSFGRWAFLEYLETHARRLYASGSMSGAETAKLILKRIRNGDLADGFTARDIQREAVVRVD